MDFKQEMIKRTSESIARKMRVQGMSFDEAVKEEREYSVAGPAVWEEILKNASQVKFTNEGDCVTKQELVGRGIRKVCTNLAGENVYSVTETAKAKLVSQHECYYQNGNDQLVEMT